MIEEINNHPTEETDHHLTKRERRRQRQQQQEEKKSAIMRRKRNKPIIGLSLAALIIIGGIAWLIIAGLKSQNTDVSNSGTPKVKINQTEYDFGDISMANGKVNYTFEIKNEGDGDLIIDSIWTSCHCTTARLQIGKKKSPEFGMDKLSTDQKIAPGETGVLEVIFNPAFHGHAGMGAITRAVYLSTNDPNNKQIEVRVSADVSS